MPSTLESKVNFFSNGLKPHLKNRQKLKQFILSIFKRERKKLETINYIFSTDRTLLDINQRYLKHGFYTDIITFDLSQNKKEIIGEIYIGLERVKGNSKKLGISFNSELHRVIFHGVLHLCGYKDKRKKDKYVMRKKEDYYLQKYFNG